LWVMLGVLLVPPAMKAFWFFIVAPAASRLRPIRICPGAEGEIGWSSPRGTDAVQGKSAVSRSILLNPHQELLIRPEFLQSSIARAKAETQLLLSWAIPLGSLATGLFGLTRIRVEPKQRYRVRGDGHCG
jgi:hypothetical protein